MKSRFACLLLLALGLCPVCSRDSSNPVIDDPTPDSSLFSICCTGDVAAAVTQYVSANNGGTIEVTTTDSIRIILAVSEHSLSTSATLTLTPLDSFAVSGPVVTTCIDTDSGTGFCFPGILCEPSGLEFDSGALLTVEFPASQPFPFDSGTTIAFFDTEDTIFYACSTVVDQANRRLSCIIYHFSGYVTVNEPPRSEEDECAALEAVFQPAYENAAAAAGTQSFYYSALRLLELRRGNYRSDPYFTGQGWIPCPSFNSQVDNVLSELISLHWSRLQSDWNQLSADVISFGQMIDHHRRMQGLANQVYGIGAYSTAEQTVTAIHLYISNKARALGTIGYNLCQADDCDGRNYLMQVLELGDQGYVVTSGLLKDDVYLQQVMDWYNDCCHTDLTVTVGSPVSDQIWRVATDVDAVYANPYSYICSLTVVVTGASGTPKPNIPVQLWREGQTYKLFSGTSDEDGKVGFTISPSRVAWSCQRFETWNLYAKAYVAESEDWVQSENSTSVTFYNLLVTTEISYQYEYSIQGGDAYLYAHASLNGSGTAAGKEAGTCSGACEGRLTRDYSYENCYHQMGDPDIYCVTASTIGGDSTYACRASVDIRSVMLENGMNVDFFFGASISLGESIFAGLIYATDNGYIDTIQYGLGMSIWPEEAIYMSAPYGTGGWVGDTTWTYQSPDEDDATQTANLHIEVTVE